MLCAIYGKTIQRLLMQSYIEKCPLTLPSPTRGEGILSTVPIKVEGILSTFPARVEDILSHYPTTGEDILPHHG